MDSFIREYREDNYEVKIVEDISTFQHNSMHGEYKIFHLDVRSIAKNFDELFILFIISLKFDMIVFPETFQIQNLEIFNISGYQTIH